MALLQKVLPILIGVTIAYGFIVPNEIPTILSLVYSNIPPLKIGQDTRFGVGFRLGPHADFQTILEIGPQTDTGKLGEDSQNKRESIFGHPPPKPPKKVPQESLRDEEKITKPPSVKKTSSPLMDKIVFNKVKGIDYR